MNKCIVTGAEITPENDSAAHVIPSALGGRLKPKRVLSREGNKILNDKVDAPLIRALQPFAALLGGSRDRGEDASIKMEAGGHTYVMTFGQPLKMAYPEYEKREEAGTVKIFIKARTMKEAEQLLGRVKSEYPDFDVQTAINAAELTSEYPSEMLGTTVNLGPNPLFPAVFAMANVYATSLHEEAHEEFQRYIELLPNRIKVEPAQQVVNVPMPPDTFYWLPKVLPVCSSEKLTHILAYFGDPVRRQALFYVELYNLPGIAVVLPYKGATVRSENYAIDVVTGQEMQITLNMESFGSAWQSTHEIPELFEVVNKGVLKILKVATDRMRNNAIEQIVEGVFGGVSVITEEHVAELSERVAAFAARMMILSGQL